MNCYLLFLFLGVMFLQEIIAQSTLVSPSERSITISTSPGPNLRNGKKNTRLPATSNPWGPSNDVHFPKNLDSRKHIISQASSSSMFNYREEEEEDPENIRRGIGRSSGSQSSSSSFGGWNTGSESSSSSMSNNGFPSSASREEEEEDPENIRRGIGRHSGSQPSSSSSSSSMPNYGSPSPVVSREGGLEPISEREVLELQNNWGNAIIYISRLYLEKGDYMGAAAEAAKDLYGYGHTDVLFKPTKAAEYPFRPTGKEAMSYFVGGNAVEGGYSEDHGFAINAGKGFSKVVFENHAIDLNGPTAISMGNYYFTCATTGAISKVEYTFGYRRNNDGKARIFLHHSSIPYSDPSATKW